MLLCKILNIFTICAWLVTGFPSYNDDGLNINIEIYSDLRDKFLERNTNGINDDVLKVRSRNRRLIEQTQDKPVAYDKVKEYWEKYGRLPTYTEGYVPETTSAPKIKAVTNNNVTSLKNHPAWKYIDDETEACGENDADRIIGGRNAALGEFPWIGRIGYRHKNRIVMKCGASLINSIYAVTAAHCNDDKNMELVRFGEYDTTTDKDCFGEVCANPPQDIKIAKIIIHESFNKPPFTHDIALIRLEKPVDYTGWVSPICLPRKIPDKPIDGTVEVAGWGFVNMKTMNDAVILQTIKLPTIPLDVCKKQLNNIQITEEHICAGGNLDEDACGGDSGGPLMQIDTSSGSPRYYLIGLVSFGPVNCGNKIPGMYTNVGYYLKWILDHIDH